MVTPKQRLKKHYSYLLKFKKANRSVRKRLISESNPSFIYCISDCVHNVLNGNVQISKALKKRLGKNKKVFRDLTKSKNNIVKKRKLILQHGNGLFLLPLLAAALPTIISLVTGK